MIYRPDIKPPMWGPPEAVQYAVRHNAERMGIDHALIGGLWPYWEQAGSVTDIFGDYSFSLPSSSGWAVNGVKYAGTGKEFTTVYPGTPDKFSVLSVVVGFDDTSQDSGIMSFRNGITWGMLHWRDEFTNDRLGLAVRNGGTTDVLYHSATMDNGPAICSVSKDGTSGYIGYNGVVEPLSFQMTNITNRDHLVLAARDGAAANGLRGTMALQILLEQGLDKNAHEMFHETPYALLMPVSRPFIFDMGAGGGTVNSNFTIQFDINNLIESDFQAVYDVLNLVDSSFVISYDIFNLTNSDFQTLFDIAGKASSDLQIVYDISGNRVPSDFVVTYDVLEKVNSEMVITFDLLNSVFSDFAPVYDIRQLVNSDFEIVFDLNNLVGSDFTILYDMAGRTFSDFTVRFDLGDVPVVVVRGSGIGLKIGIGI